MTTLRFLSVPVLGLAVSLGAVGCANERHDEIPENATLNVEGGQQLAFRAPQDGTVYVYDTGDDAMVYSGHVKKGHLLVVDPDKDRITVDGRTVLEKSLDNERRRIFFKEADPVDRVVVPAGAQIEVQDSPPARIEIEQRKQPETNIQIEREPDARIEVEDDSAKIRVEEDSGTQIEVND